MIDALNGTQKRILQVVKMHQKVFGESLFGITMNQPFMLMIEEHFAALLFLPETSSAYPYLIRYILFPFSSMEFVVC